MKKLIKTVQDWEELLAFRVVGALVFTGLFISLGGTWALGQGAPGIVAPLCFMANFSLWGLAGVMMTIRQEFYFIITIHGPATLPINIFFTIVCWFVVGYSIIVLISYL